MKAFVTGVTGFIGGALTRRLVSQGWHVTALVRDAGRAADLQALGVQLVVGDLLRPEAYSGALVGKDVLFHCAAIVDVIRPSREAILETNVRGTRAVLEAARVAGVKRAVHLSSVAAFGRQSGDVDESVWNRGSYNSLYEESKHGAEQAALEVGRAGLPIVHVLPSIVIGPGDPKTGAFFRQYLRHEIPALPGVEAIVNLVHVDDLVDGILLALEKGRANERYVMSQAAWSTEEFFSALEQASGVRRPMRVPYWVAWAGALSEEGRAWLMRRKPRVSRSSLRAAARRARFVSRRAREELGWAPRPFEERFRETVQYWKEEVTRPAAPK